MAAPWMRLGLAALALAVSAPPHARAQDAAAQGAAAPGEGPTPGRDLGAGLAAQVGAAAVAACAGRGWPVTAAVDRAGQVKALLRGDGALSRGPLRGPSLRGIAARSFADITPWDRLRRWSHTVAAALAKAYTAAGLRDSTGAVLDAVQRVPGARHLPAIEGVLSVGGGLPIRADDGPGAEMAGAIGVSGAPSGPLDEECARSGVARAREGLR